MKLSRGWWTLLLVSLAVMIPFAAPYAMLSPDASRIPVVSVTIQFPLLIAHIAASFAALVTGFFQFVPRLQTERPAVHRRLGRLYAAAVFAGGATALPLVFYSGTYTKASGFLALTVIWLFTTWQGFRAAVAGRIEEHRRWMTRSFGITLAAVGARLLVPLLLLFYLTYHGFSLPAGRAAMIDAVLDVNIWAGLVLNLILTEWVVLRPGRRISGSGKEE